MRGRWRVRTSVAAIAWAAISLGAPRPTIAQAASAPGSRGRMVEVGDMSFRIVCEGSGGPTVVVETGAGQWSLGWAGIQEALASDLRVCTYDRRGLGLSSDGSGPVVYSAGAAADDLHRILEAAGEAPPYILVGHSFGGYVVRIFADRHPDLVAGVALVESGHEDQWTELPVEVSDFIANGTSQLGQFQRALEAGAVTGDALPPHPVFSSRADWDAEYRDVMTRPSHIAAQIGTIRDMPVSLRELREVGDLGDLPLLVISAENSFEAFPNAPIPFGEANAAWMRLQRKLPALSRRSWQVLSRTGTHNVNWVDPSVVTDGLRALADTVRANGTKPAGHR